MQSRPAGTDFRPDQPLVKYDPKTGIYRSSVYEAQHYADDLRVDQLIFDYTPEQAAAGGQRGAGHWRPDPTTYQWLSEPHTGRSWGYAQCKERRDEIAKVLHAHLGVRSDDTIAVYAHNDIDYPTLMWGAWRIGGIISGANPTYTEEELTTQIEVLLTGTTLKGLVTHPDSLPVALAAARNTGIPHSKILLLGPNSAKPADCPADILSIDEAIAKYGGDQTTLPPDVKLKPGEAFKKVCCLAFSSGTTGLPKAVMLTHGNLVSNVSMMLRVWNHRAGPGDKALAFLPFYHSYGILAFCVVSPYYGVHTVIMPKFDFATFLKLTVTEKIQIHYFVPPILILMSKHPAVKAYEPQLREIMREVLVAAAPLTDEIVAGFKQRFPNTHVFQAYGLTETGIAVAIGARVIDGKSPGASGGTLVPNLAAKVVDMEQKPLGPGQVGEFVVQTPSRAIGYLANPKATAEMFDDEGWVHTGDEGYIDERGWLFVIDRRKELIKVKGNQVAPAELEGFLLGHPSVSDVCVIGVPDEYAGELPRAYIVPTAEVAGQIKHDRRASEDLADSVRKWVADAKIGYKHLAGGVEFTDAIPKNPSGKLLRRQLRDRYKAEHPIHVLAN